MNKDIISRLGELNISNEGYDMKIIEYNAYNDIWIEFQDRYKTKIHTTYYIFKNGSIKNPYHKTSYGVGYLGVGKYKCKKNGKITKCYKTWSHMLERCYDPYRLNEFPTYIDCYVCEEWHNFQNFAKWYEENYYEVKEERMNLDKDILIKGNKIYSPETCIFVPQRINILFTKSDKTRGEYPIGIHKYSNNKIRVLCSIYDGEKGKKVKIHLGCFSLNEILQAFTCYKNFKENYIKQVADEYKDLIPIKLYNALYNYQVEIND